MRVHLLPGHVGILRQMVDVVVAACSLLSVEVGAPRQGAARGLLGDAVLDVARGVDCVRLGCRQSAPVPGSPLPFQAASKMPQGLMRRRVGVGQLLGKTMTVGRRRGKGGVVGRSLPAAGSSLSSSSSEWSESLLKWKGLADVPSPPKDCVRLNDLSGTVSTVGT